MSFGSALGQFPKWFHILGQNIEASFANHIPTLNAKNAVKYIPTVVVLALAIFAALLLCIFSNSFGDYALFSSFSKIANAQLAVLLGLDLLTALVVAGQAFFLSSQYSKLYAQIDVIERLSRKKFSWDLNGLRRSVIRKMCIICAAFALPYIIITCTKRITPAYIVIMSCDCALASLSLITYFHILFYIQLLNHMLESFVKYVKLRPIAFTTTGVATINERGSHIIRMKLEMYYFKLLHFNLCEFAQTINHVFGWILIIYLLNHFLYTVYIFFQTCIILLNPTNSLEIYRKSKIIHGSDLDVQWVCAKCVHRVTNHYFAPLPVIGSIADYISTFTSTIILINACHQCANQVRFFFQLLHRAFLQSHMCFSCAFPIPESRID